jgi:hypothetical protein
MMVRLPSASRARRRLGLALTLSLLAQAAAPLAFAQATDPKAQMAAGEKAAQKKDWAAALAAYEAANKASPSEGALEGVANAHYQMKHDAEAYAAYDEWLKTYGAKANAAKKKTAETRLKELGERTGAIEIAVSEGGATISVDDKPVGQSPLAAPLRLAAGPHRVRITKDGFHPFDQTPNVAAATTAKIDAKLEPQANKGRLTVREKTGKPIRVIVDGVDMGEAPWTGDVDVGQHEVAGRSTALSAAPERVTVERGKTREVELVASASTATIKISTSDGKGLIYIDGKLVGEGSFSGDIPAGPHKLRITREGYDPFEEDIVLEDKQTIARAVTLKIVSSVQTGPIEAERRALEGVYGGFGLPLYFSPSGFKASMQTLCDERPPPELGGCDKGSGIGFGVNGFVGYHWDPVGVELFLGASYDTASPKLDWNASSTDPGLGPDPARTEDFSLHRIGGFGAARVRLTLQSEKIRFSVAGGVGLSYKTILLERDAKAKSDPNQRDLFVPGAQGYWSPLISLEPAVYYRLGQPTSLGVGFTFQMEAAGAFGDNPKTPADGTRKIGPVGITTPAYELASGTQIFIGPFIGMIFGP